MFGSNFGTQGGFAGFTGVNPAKKDGDGEEANGEDAEEECKAEFTPLVQLEEVETNTGEENEECLLEMCDYRDSSTSSRIEHWSTQLSNLTDSVRHRMRANVPSCVLCTHP